MVPCGREIQADFVRLSDDGAWYIRLSFDTGFFPSPLGGATNPYRRRESKTCCDSRGFI